MLANVYVANFHRFVVGERDCFIEADLAVDSQSVRGILSLLSPIGWLQHQTTLHKTLSLVTTQFKKRNPIHTILLLCSMIVEYIAYNSKMKLLVVAI